jgi:hypothetical protein
MFVNRDMVDIEYLSDRHFALNQIVSGGVYFELNFKHEFVRAATPVRKDTVAPSKASVNEAFADRAFFDWSIPATFTLAVRNDRIIHRTEAGCVSRIVEDEAVLLLTSSNCI